MNPVADVEGEVGSMPRGYDGIANEAWERAKVLAEADNRRLSLVDLWWGVWAMLDTADLGLSLPDSVRRRLDDLRARRAEGKVKVSDEVKVLDMAIREACREQGRPEATLWDMLLALLERDDAQIAEMLAQWGLRREALVSIAQDKRSDERMSEPLPPGVLASLQPFVVNLTESAARGELESAYERDEEREALLIVLLGKNKRNAALVGPAGVGKTKLVEDLALRIYRGEIPQLRGCVVLSLNLVGLQAGTEVHGELQQRVQDLRDVLERYGDRIILFIDELHTVVGTSVGGHVLDLANALKPLLASGKIRCIGATTRQEFVQYIEADRALARRFQEIKVQEPSRETTARILEKVKAKYEAAHDVVYPPETLQAILDLSERLLPMRHFPDKAIDLLDKTGAYAALQRASQHRRVVLEEDVRAVLARLYHVRADSLETFTPDQLARRLGEVVVGQETALRLLSQSVLTAPITQEQQRPRAVWLFAGPRGVGKTLAAKTLTEILCRNEKAFLEIDLTLHVRRYQYEATDVDMLIGVPEPFIGSKRGGLLTNHVMEFPHSVVFVRGAEQASPEVRALLVRIFETGSCEDGRGQVVHFGGVFFVLACDLGSEERKELGFVSRTKPTKFTWYDPDVLRKQLEEHGFPAELLRNVQAIIPFAPLTPETLRAFARRELEQIRQKLYLQEKKTLEYDETLIEWLTADEGDGLTLTELEQRIEQWIQRAVYQLKAQARERWKQWQVVRLALDQSRLQAESVAPRLLVVDDAPDFYKTLQESYPDWQWRYAATLEQAEQAITLDSPHLVLVDTCQSANEPEDIRGLDILRALKTRFPEQAIVMVTAHPMGFETTRQAFRQGAYDYLWKPPEESVLRQIVTLLVEREQKERQLAYQWQLLRNHLPLSYEIRDADQQVQVLFKS